METSTHKVKKDKFTKARGGSSKFLLIKCSQCANQILLYQKDGPGGLMRLYLDKIHAPEKLVLQLSTFDSKEDLPALKCEKCDQLIALPMIYVPESRLAYKLIRGTVHKEKSKGQFPIM